MIGIVLFVGRSHFTCTFFLFRESRIEKKLRKGTIITSRMIWLRSPVPPPPTCSSWAQLAWQWYYPDAVSPQWDCCEPSSGRVSPRGYCKALWLPVYSTESTPGIPLPNIDLINSYMALVCCRVDESAPYETNVGIPHSHGRIGTRTAGLTGYSEPPMRSRRKLFIVLTPSRAACVNCGLFY